MASGARFQLYKWALGLAAASVQSLIYFGIGHRHIERSPTLLLTAWDQAIPFWPWTVWLYLPFYVGIFVLAIAGLRDVQLFHRGMVGVAATMLVGAAGHLLVPAEYPRPSLAAVDASTSFMVWLHEIDPPGNVFPSLHVAHGTSLALILRQDRRPLGTMAVIMAVILAASTLTTKQHFLADVVVGLALGWAVQRWVRRPFLRPTGALKPA